MRISGKSVILTGASSGIGRALVSPLVGRGALLTTAARRGDRLAAACRDAALLHPGSPTPVAVPCDVTDARAVSLLVGGAVERLGAVDVLINNAGVSAFGVESRTSLDDYREIMEVNFYGALNCMREVLPFMVRRGEGLIVNMLSVAALHGVPYLSAYCASKAALLAVSEVVRAECADAGVRVMLVYPGYTESEIFDVEKRVGGARRPPGKYAPADAVAERIVRAVEADRTDLFLTLRGRALSVLRGLAPPVVDGAMRKIARELRCPDEPGGEE
ncbi:MAG: SDR family NAD(P)-dependent oxidoreductase [Candidatus Eisenbacteria bacterium]